MVIEKVAGAKHSNLIHNRAFIHALATFSEKICRVALLVNEVSYPIRESDVVVNQF